MKNNPISVFILCLIPVLFLVTGCGGQSEEDRLKETIKTIGDYAEDRDVESILEYLSPDYSDDENRKAEDILKLLENYTQYHGIAVNILSTDILSLALPNAEIETEVALSSGAAKFFRKAVPYSGRFYRFHVKWVKSEDQWLVVSAEWHSVSMEELFPESMKILKKIFPQIQ